MVGFNLFAPVRSAEAATVTIWLENLPVFDLFLNKMGDQWRVGMNGPVGLDHNVLFRHLDRMGLTADAWDVMFADIVTMERAALKKMSEK
ncbi:MAG: Protein of unknown function phage-related [Rhodoferax sp.]|nr:Protein of unknown function phage-related [Rhodoferax sp.]